MPNHTSQTHQWLIEASISEMQAEMARGTISSRELVAWYFSRIAEYDASCSIHSVLEINADALHIADRLDWERQQGQVRGPLHGIPILLKDNIDTADKMHTSAGTLALADSYAGRDATVVKRLRAAGAVILGKTNMTEWAHFMDDRMPSGYSARGGQVKNPYGPGSVPVGGSSSGSAAAVAANFAAAALGTDTSGSITCPSIQNALVGIRPTVGMVSRFGIIPISHTQDTAGPMARSVEDAVIVLSAIAGADPRDPATRTAFADYQGWLDPGGLRGARIGFVREPYFEQLTVDQQRLMEGALSVMADAGAMVRDAMIATARADWGQGEVLVHEFKVGVNAYLARLRAHVPVHSLAEVIAFNERHHDRALRYGQDVLIRSQQTSGTLTDSGYLSRLFAQARMARMEGIDASLARYQVDVLLFPGYLGYPIGARAGYPSITVPAGYLPTGEPFGVTFTGTAFSEKGLIRIAYAFEQLTRHRIPPPLASPS